jgi:hypothetical protein
MTATFAYCSSWTSDEVVRRFKARYPDPKPKTWDPKTTLGSLEKLPPEVREMVFVNLPPDTLAKPVNRKWRNETAPLLSGAVIEKLLQEKDAPPRLGEIFGSISWEVTQEYVRSRAALA